MPTDTPSQERDAELAPDPGSKPAEADRLMLCAALLAGLGGRAPLAARRPVECAHAAAASERTCVDAGAPMLMSVFAPGARRFCAIARDPDRSEDVGVERWLRFSQAAHDDGDVQTIEHYRAGAPGTWARATALARDRGAGAAFAHQHAALGPRGHLFSATYSQDRTAPLSVSWHLDSGSSPVDALTACGVPDGWAAAAALLSQILGREISARSGPWSVTCTFGADDRVRLGTTAWARSIEDDAKRRRLVDAVCAMGGDGRFAEALYKLLAAARPAFSGARIGRALEVELSRGGKALGLEAYLCFPQPVATRLILHYV